MTGSQTGARWDVTITAPGCPRDPVIPVGIVAAMEVAGAAFGASGLVSAWSADRTVLTMTLEAGGAARAEAVARELVAVACRDRVDLGKAVISVSPAGG